MAEQKTAETAVVDYVGISRATTKTDIDECVEAVSRTGYFVFHDFFTNRETDALREKVLAAWQKQNKHFGEAKLRDMGEYGVARSLLEYDFSFSKLLLNPKLNEILAATVGATAILHLMNGIVLSPASGHSQRRLHRDFAKDFIASKILSINFFVMLDDFSTANGSTEYLPASHRDELIPSESYIEKNIESVEAKRGSVLVFDSLLLHRTGVNATGDTRVGLNMQFTRPFIKQQIDYPQFFKPQIDPNGLLAQRLGYWSVAPRGVEEYRVNDPKLRTYRAGQG